MKKFLERVFYRGYWYFGNGSSPTIKNWFMVKDNTFRGLKHVTKRQRHRRSFFRCRLPKIVGNRIIYRLFKATKWFKEPNIKYRREEKNYEKTKAIYL